MSNDTVIEVKVYSHGHTHSTGLDRWDRAGIFLSTLCAIHCLVTPLVGLALPLLGEAFEQTWVHVLMAILIVPIGIFAFWTGYKHHHQRHILIMGLAGLFLIATASVVPRLWISVAGHDVVTVLGSAVLITAHLFNRKAVGAHRC